MPQLRIRASCVVCCGIHMLTRAGLGGNILAKSGSYQITGNRVDFNRRAFGQWSGLREELSRAKQSVFSERRLLRWPTKINGIVGRICDEQATYHRTTVENNSGGGVVLPKRASFDSARFMRTLGAFNINA